MNYGLFLHACLERKLKPRAVLVKKWPLQCHYPQGNIYIVQKSSSSKMNMIAIKKKIKRRGCLDVTLALEFRAPEIPS